MHAPESGEWRERCYPSGKTYYWNRRTRQSASCQHHGCMGRCAGGAQRLAQGSSCQSVRRLIPSWAPFCGNLDIIFRAVVFAVVFGVLVSLGEYRVHGFFWEISPGVSFFPATLGSTVNTRAAVRIRFLETCLCLSTWRWTQSLFIACWFVVSLSVQQLFGTTQRTTKGGTC